MSKIQWTDATWNPVTGCEYASPGCKNCYAVVMTKRLEAMGQEKYQGLLGKAHFNGVVKTHEDELTKPLRWKKPRMVFVNSMSDLFHPSVPFEFIDRVFAVMALTPQHTYQVLTKRPERMAEYFTEHHPLWDKALDSLPHAADIDVTGTSLGSTRDITDEYYIFADKWPLPNVWLGTSCENQEMLELRVPHLLKCPASVRFLSCEPLLGSLNLDANRMGIRPWHDEPWMGGINWVIVGGESGSKSRHCNIEWIRSIVRQCQDASVPVFVKQLGSKPTQDGLLRQDNDLQGYHREQFPLNLIDRKGGNPDEWPEDLRVRQFPEVAQ